MKIYLKDIVERFPEFEVKNYQSEAFFVGFSHDTRTLKDGELYIPIEGEKHDGHDFILDSFEKGASISMCEAKKYDESMEVNKPIILVDSIEEGLQKILNYAISPITAPVVAITGSTGKTTTKQMLVTILEKSKKVLYSDNSNTVWGNAVLLSQYDNHDVVVLECAMDRKGEIAWHVNSVDPDLGILLNIGYVHGEKVGDIEDIYREKKNLADYMEKTGKPLVLNIDDERLVRIKDNYREGAELITFGKSKDAEFKILDVKVDDLGTHFTFEYYDNKIAVDLKVLGEGYVYNALAAIISANRLGISIDSCVESIKNFECSNGRFEKLEYGDSITIVNDAYNANPDSMDMALKTFNQLFNTEKYQTIVILGDMKELGEVSETKHKELGDMVRNYNFDNVYYVGEMFESFQVGEHLDSADEVAAMLNIKLENLKEKKIAILLKGSNSIGLYQVPDFLKKLGVI